MTSTQLESELYVIAKWARTCITLAQLELVEVFYRRKLRHLSFIKELLPVYKAMGWVDCTITTQRGMIKAIKKLKTNKNQ